VGQRPLNRAEPIGNPALAGRGGGAFGQLSHNALPVGWSAEESVFCLTFGISYDKVVCSFYEKEIIADT